MTSGVSSGTTSTGTGIFIGGIASKLNTAALVEAAVNQRLAKADKLDLRAAGNLDKINAFNNLRTLGTNFQSKLNALKLNLGFGNTTVSAFDKTQAFTSSSTLTDPRDFVTVTSNQNADLQTFDLEIVRTAKAHKVTSGAGLVADQNAALGYTGSFDIGIASVGTASINITAGMNLRDVANAINNELGNAGVRANIIQVAANDFRLNVTADATGENISYATTGGTDIFQALGITDGGGVFQNVIQAAETAQIRVDGVLIERNTNSINDVIEGVTFDLINASPGDIIKVDVERDASSVKQGIQDFMDAFNEIRQFVLDNQARDEAGDISEEAVLYNDNILNQMNSVLQSLVSRGSSVSGDITGINVLGIKLDSKNMLVISDEAKLDEAILNNFDNVRAFFQTGMASNNSNFALFRNTSVNGALNFTVDITVDGGGNVNGASIGGDSSMFTIDGPGNRIIGVAGTAYEGLEFAYVGGVNASVAVNLTQGLADLMGNNLDPYVNSVSGQILDRIGSLEDQNEDLEQDAGDIRIAAEDYRQQLINKYAKLETEVQAADLLRRQLQAIIGKKDDDD